MPRKKATTAKGPTQKLVVELPEEWMHALRIHCATNRTTQREVVAELIRKFLGIKEDS
jgi:hypothetical protein